MNSVTQIAYKSVCKMEGNLTTNIFKRKEDLKMAIKIMEENNMETKEVTKVDTEVAKEITNDFEEAIKDDKKKFNPVTWFNGLKLWQKIALGAVAGVTLFVGGYKLHIKLNHGKLIAETVVDNADKVVEAVAEAAPEVTETVVETVTEVAETVAEA